MDILRNKHDILPSILLSINRVHCYLEVYSMTDIATGDGTKIRNNFLLGTPSDSNSIWDWHCESPFSQDFTHWKWAMTLLSDERQILLNPLGPWTALPHHKWIWLYSLQEDVIYNKYYHNWTSYSRSTSVTRTCQKYIRSQPQTKPSFPLAITTVLLIDTDTIIYEGTDFTNVSSLPPALPKYQDSFWILKESNIHHTYTQPWVTDRLVSGNLLAVCDGSYKSKLSSHGICIIHY